MDFNETIVRTERVWLFVCKLWFSSVQVCDYQCKMFRYLIFIWKQCITLHGQLIHDNIWNTVQSVRNVDNRFDDVNIMAEYSTTVTEGRLILFIAKDLYFWSQSISSLNCDDSSCRISSANTGFLTYQIYSDICYQRSQNLWRPLRSTVWFIRYDSWPNQWAPWRAEE